MFTQITRTGNLTKPPTLFRDQDGGKYTYASIACSRRFKDKASGSGSPVRASSTTCT